MRGQAHGFDLDSLTSVGLCIPNSQLGRGHLRAPAAKRAAGAGSGALGLRVEASREPGSKSKVELIIRNLESFIPQPENPQIPSPLLSRLAGPPNSFRIQLRVCTIVPGRYGCLGVFIYLMPGPMQDIGSEWIVQDAKCEVTIFQEGAASDWVVKEAATFCFTDEESGNGWSELWPQPLPVLASWVGLGRLVVRATVEFPLQSDSLKDIFRGLDFSQEVTQVTVRLAEGPPLFFDKRVLMACSEYFRDMLAEPRFKEGCSNEIDLSSDPHADHRAVSAIFRPATHCWNALLRPEVLIGCPQLILS